MEETQAEQTQEEMVSVPKGSTVNKEKYERANKRAEDAEAQIEALKQQIEELTASSEADKQTIEDFKAKVAESSAKYEADKSAWEAESARKDMANELLKAGCIDTESALASLHEGMTIEQLKGAKPHLFGNQTKPSSAAQADKAPEDTFAAALRKAFGLS